MRKEPPLDRIHIRDLKLRCIIGIYPEERRAQQDVIVNITLYCDLRKACESDNISDTVNYKEVKKKVVAMIEESSCLLIERLADQVAAIALESPGVERVNVVLDKPGALRFAKSVAVDITRDKA